MHEEQVSIEGPIHIYSSRQIAPWDFHGQGQLEFTIE